MSGLIRKQKIDNNYSIIPNEILRNKEITWKAKGLLCYLLSMSDDWKLHKSDLANRSKDGYESMLSAWKELENVGFIETVRLKTGNLFSGYEYIVHQSPVLGLFVNTESRATENQELISTPLEEVSIPIIDSKLSNVGLEKPTTTNSDVSYSERCRKFIDLFNSTKIVNGRPSKYQTNNGLCGSLKQRLKKYNPEQIIEVLKKSMKHKFHIDNNFVYVTPEYVLREKTIEKYLNMEIEIEETEKGYVP